MKMRLKTELGFMFEVLEIDADRKLVLGFSGKDDIAIWYTFSWFTPYQVSRMEKACVKNGRYYRYY